MSLRGGTEAETTVQKPVVKTGLTEVEKWAGFCAVAKSITWSPKDSVPTVVQIKAYNQVGKEKCHWGQ